MVVGVLREVVFEILMITVSLEDNWRLPKYIASESIVISSEIKKYSEAALT